jgi:hypothetical protein
MTIPTKLVNRHKTLKRHSSNGELEDGEQTPRAQECPGYAREWLLVELGAQFKYQEDARITVINGRAYRTAGIIEAIGKRPNLIRGTADLVKRVRNLPKGIWLYRGHCFSTWPLRCSLDRAECKAIRGTLSRAEYEATARTTQTIFQDLQALGITRSALFPGLDALCSELRETRW